MARAGLREALHGGMTRKLRDELTGHTVVTSGASGGLGLDLARVLTRRGCTLALSARALEEVAP